jgi:hypothetical protein
VRGGEVLPARTCSTCVNWLTRFYGADEQDGILVATCDIDQARRAGGDKCSKWERQEHG